MTDDQKVGDAPAEGAVEAKQPVSQEGAKPIDGDAIKELIKEEISVLQKELRGLQGRQDKAEGGMADFQKRLAEYQKNIDKGMQPNEAFAEMQKADSEAEWRTNLEKKIDTLSARLGDVGSTPNEQRIVAEVLDEFGLDPKDSYIASQLQGKKFSTKTEAMAFAGKLYWEKTNAPKPNAAQEASSPAAPAGEEEEVDVAALSAEHSRLLKNPTQNMARIKEIQNLLNG